jgi:hypothetical protein
MESLDPKPDSNDFPDRLKGGSAVHFSYTWLLLLGIPLLQAPENGGIKMTIEFGEFGAYGSSRQSTTYIQGDRERTEYRNSFGRRQPSDRSVQPIYGPRLARIIRCDLGQYFELNLDTSEYTASPYPPKQPTKEEIKARGLETPATRMPGNPTIRVETKTTNTGERKEMFGRMARHVITTTTQTALEGSHSDPQQSITDGWYIDFDQQLSCEQKRPKGGQGYISVYMSAGRGKPPMEKPEFVTVGEPEMGLALYSLTTSKSASTLPDAYTSKSETRVTQFEEGPLDPALFEIPPGFKLVDRIERNPPPSAFAGKP